MATQNQEDDDIDNIDVDINPFRMFPLQQQNGQLQEPPFSLENRNIDADVDPAATRSQQLEQSHFLHSINAALFIRQLPSEGLSFQLWPAATTLVTLLDHHCCHSSITSPLSPLFEGRRDNRPLRILELGSGTGLVGIAAAAVLGAKVTVTDLPHVLPNLQFNIEANSRVAEVNGGAVNAAALSWGDTEHMEALGKEYDFILGSDVVYHDHLYVPLLKTLRFFLLGNKEREIVFVMAHLRRWKKESAFFKKAKKLFDVEIIHTDAPTSGSRVGVVVYRFVVKCNLSVRSENVIPTSS